MKVKLRLYANIVEENGRLRVAFKNPAYYQQQLSQLSKDKSVIVTIENQQSTRSRQQNKYWHGVCFPILAELMSLNETEAKEICIEEYILPKVITFKGKERELRRGTHELSKSEGVLFTDNIRQLAVELGGYIPTPCESGYFCGRRECDICAGKIDAPSTYEYPTQDSTITAF